MKDKIIENINIDKMTIYDLEEISRLEKEIFSAPWSKESLKYEIGYRTNSVAYKVEYNKRIIAYTFSWIVLDEIHIGNFAVVKEFRKRGIGKYLLRYIIDKGKELGASFFYLEVRKSNKPAINLYKKEGFKTIGVRKNYYSDNNEDALVMGFYV